jgi:hypothetical protein
MDYIKMDVIAFKYHFQEAKLEAWYENVSEPERYRLYHAVVLKNDSNNNWFLGSLCVYNPSKQRYEHMMRMYSTVLLDEIVNKIFMQTQINICIDNKHKFFIPI